MGLLSKLLGSAATAFTPKPKWVPLYPDAVARNEPLGEPADFAAEMPAAPWHAAPAASHLKRFRYLDTRTDPIQRKFVGRSAVQVEFDTGTLFAYYFADAAAGRAVFDEMVGADSPGTVLSARLVAPRVPYERKV